MWVSRQQSVDHIPKLPSSSDANTGAIRIYDGRGEGQTLSVVEKLHRFPVHVMTVSRQTSMIVDLNLVGPTSILIALIP